MQPKSRKLLSLALALVLCLSLFAAAPTAAKAAPGDVCSIGSTTYATLGAALAAVPAGGSATIKLLANIINGSGIVVNNQNITFDLSGGFSLNINTTADAALTVSNNGYVMSSSGGYFNVIGAKYGVKVESGGRALVSYATANGTGGAAAFATGTDSGVQVIQDAKATNAAGGIGAQAQDGATVYVYGNVSSAGNTGVYSWGGVIVVRGNITAAGTGADARNGGEINIDGTVSGTPYIWVGDTSKTQADGVPSAAYPGYLLYADGTSHVYVKDTRTPVCQIGPTTYATLDAALMEVPAGGSATIKLLQNIDYTKTITADNKNITFDMNGYALNVEVTGSRVNAVEVLNNGTIGLVNPSNGEFNVKSSTGYGVNVESGQVTVTNVTGAYVGVSIFPKGIVNVLKNVTASTGVYAHSRCTANVGGNVTSTTMYGVQANGGTVNVTGNVVCSGDKGAYAMNGGIVKIDGTLSGTPYIMVGTTDKTKADVYTPTTLSGYLTYTDGTSTVWVKDLAATAPVITTASLPNGTVGTAYTQTLAATGAAPIAWSISAGSLPAGLNLNTTTGAITGTPTAAGTSTFTVKATNSLDSNTKQLSITVAASDVPAITTASLPNGTVGTAYSQTLAATGATPITWSISAGSLPAGLSLNTTTGVLSGTPTAAGTSTFTVKAANSLGSDTKQLSLTVVTAAPPAWSKTSDWALPEMQQAQADGLIPDSLKGGDFTKPITRAEFAGVCVKLYENLTGKTVSPAASNPFTDTNSKDVLKALNANIMMGTSPTTFAPDMILNRETAATALTRVLKRAYIPGWTYDTDGQYALTFTMPAKFADDANISGWAYSSVYFMAANSIIKGMGNNKFAPRNITSAEMTSGYANNTREQALAIAVRIVDNLKGKPLSYN